MKTNRVIHVVSCHAEGEVGDVIVGGITLPIADSLWEQSRQLQQDSDLRDFMLNEPRGGVFRHINLLVSPFDERADLGFIIMEPSFFPPMSGSNAMCVATVALETGILSMEEPITEVKLEAPGGIVTALAHCDSGKVEKVTIENVPSFVDKLDAQIEVPGLGSLTVDIAYGGDSFCLISADSLGLALTSDEAFDIVQIGRKVTASANEQLGFHHPKNPDWNHISFCMITDKAKKNMSGEITARHTVIIQPGKLDRSPCGTGCSARMAVMQARGELQPGQKFIGESIIGSRFECEYQGPIDFSDQRIAIIPLITGRAWITGIHQHMIDPDDPWPTGYRLSDTWPSPNKS